MLRRLLVLACLMVITRSGFAQTPLTHPPRLPPKRGMTKAEVLARYGEPRYRTAVDGAETWFYRTKFNEVYGRAFAPFDFSSRNVNLGEVRFDRQGKISRYYWTYSAGIGQVLGF